MKNTVEMIEQSAKGQGFRSDAMLGVKCLRWDGVFLVVDGEPWAHYLVSTPLELARMVLLITIEGEPDEEHIHAFAVQMIEPLFKGFTMQSDAPRQWLKAHVKAQRERA